MNAKQTSTKRWVTIIIAATVVVAVITATITALAFSILERKTEARAPKSQVVALDETTVDPAVWGRNYPAQYQSFMKTKEMVPGPGLFDTMHPVTQEPTDADPRTQVMGQRTEEDPRLTHMWAGYAFAKDYRHPRGHHYMLEDQRLTKRVQDFDQPGTCLNCHASMPAVYDKAGNGDREAGFHAINKMTYAEATKLAEHPVTCIDCHDPKTMELRITRPAFARGITALKKSQGIEDFDPNRDATHNEMRTFVCAQCHVEYYFKGDEKTLTFPWDKGIDIDDIYSYYQDAQFVDWTHAETGAPMLKAQHPEFDIWSNGIHARNGVSCADCHMPYESQGAQKVSDHNLTTPLKTVNSSCMTCHHASDEEMIKRVEGIQGRFVHSRDQAFDALVQLIADIKAERDANGETDDVKRAWDYQRKASFYVDYVYSENSHGFHAPDYVQRILNDALEACRKGQLALKGVSDDAMSASDNTLKNAEKVAKSRG
ncbi:MAG: ammonia-forming cytochrome c nitrite reductase subunit c552 [Actinomycetaceae bacterium]|nr:ammonia-forming cytochrome c nitrite reductase subunit c552 [Actinomycetaceae bacterium]